MSAYTGVSSVEPCSLPMTIAVSAFYKFVLVDDPQTLRASLFAALHARAMKGTILVASEGINGTISGTPEAMATFLVSLRSDHRFADLVTKDTTTDAHPFQRLKVKLKREIISFGHVGADPSQRVGTYVSPGDWNALISDPEVVMIDTRNAYEVDVGTFPGAIDPKTRAFGDLPEFVKANLDPRTHRKVAMFCTGGIRCEKASAYLMSLGFPEVYHLKGGILAYLATVPREASLWQGECFVFDEREGVKQADGDVAVEAPSIAPSTDRNK